MRAGSDGNGCRKVGSFVLEKGLVETNSVKIRGGLKKFTTKNKCQWAQAIRKTDVKSK